MKALRYAIIGILNSLSFSYIFVTLSVLSDHSSIPGESLLKQLIIAIVFGAAVGLVTLIFEIERLPYLVLLIIHLLAVTLLVTIAGMIGDWFQSFGIVNVLISEAVIYALVWIFSYILVKKDVAKINEEIKKRRE